MSHGRRIFQFTPNFLMSNGKQNSIGSQPEKIFYIWNYLDWGGAQVYFFGLMREVKKTCEVTALMPAGSHPQLLKFLDNLNVSYKFFDAHTDLKPAADLRRKLERHWNKVRCEFIVYKYLRSIDLDNAVLHVEFAPWQSLILLLWLCRKARVFVTVHNAMPPVSDWRFRLWKLKFHILSRFGNFNIFTANKNAKESLKPLVPDEFYEKITIVSANINPREIEEALRFDKNKPELCRKYDLPADKFLVFCVGQFIDRKGRWIFLEAARELIETNKNIHFVWISNSKPGEADLRKIETYRLENNFTLISSERVGDEHIDLFKLLRIADVFCLPSFVEGLPISLLEAMALGIPSISTNVNGIPEAVKHLETGWLIETGDVRGLIDAVKALKTDKSLREKLSRNGRDLILKNFNETTVAKIALEKYRESFQANHKK